MKTSIFTPAVTLLLLLGSVSLTPLLADLPGESFAVDAFFPEKRILCQSAVGVLTVKPFFSSTDQSAATENSK